MREKGLEAVFSPDLAGPFPLVVELGFGGGEFLQHLAAESPERAHLGVERSFKRVLKMARRMARGDDGNIRLIHGIAEQVVREALPLESVATFWVNFPDPWPKKRHHKHRLLQPPFVAQLARRLVCGGGLEIATDHEDYALAIDRALRAESRLENTLDEPFRREVPGRLHTAFELEWRAEGRALHFWSYRRRSKP